MIGEVGERSCISCTRSRRTFRSAGTFAICGFIQGESWGSFNLLAIFPSGDSGPPTTTTVAPSDVTLIMREKRGSQLEVRGYKMRGHSVQQRPRRSTSLN